MLFLKIYLFFVVFSYIISLAFNFIFKKDLMIALKKNKISIEDYRKVETIKIWIYFIFPVVNVFYSLLVAAMIIHLLFDSVVKDAIKKIEELKK